MHKCTPSFKSGQVHKSTPSQLHKVVHNCASSQNPPFLPFLPFHNSTHKCATSTSYAIVSAQQLDYRCTKRKPHIAYTENVSKCTRTKLPVDETKPTRRIHGNVKAQQLNYQCTKLQLNAQQRNYQCTKRKPHITYT